MANTKKTPAKPKTTAATEAKKPVKVQPTEKAAPVELAVVTPTPDIPTEEAPWVADEHLSDRVPVRSAVYGTLIYVDTLSHRKWEWSAFGKMRHLTIETLENARNSQEAFFVNGWWEIDSSYEHKDELLEYLDAAHLYSKDVNIDNFDTLLKRSAAEITAVIGKLPVSQKVQFVRRAQELIKEGRLDSISAIRAIEKTLGVELEY